MAIKYIRYTPKITHANTTYVDIDKQDMLWLQTELIRYLSVMGEIDNHKNTDLQQIMKFYWYKKTKTLPRGINGMNSPLTFVSGLVNNLVFGTQRDLSTVVLDSIENISNQMVLLEDAISDIKTQKSTITSVNIKFIQNIIQFSK